MSLRAELEALLEKYRLMRDLRARVGEPPRDVLRDLAKRFPGALAEIDRISSELLDERTEQVRALLELANVDEPSLPLWIRASLRVHSALRGALEVKTWLAGRREVDDEMRRAFGEQPFSAEATAWSDRLAELADPPNGRMVDLVYADVARELGVEASSVRDLLMPRP